MNLFSTLKQPLLRIDLAWNLKPSVAITTPIWTIVNRKLSKMNFERTPGILLKSTYPCWTTKGTATRHHPILTNWMWVFGLRNSILLVTPLIMISHMIPHFSHRPQINEFSIMDLDRDHFQFACSILQSTIFNAATPMHQFDIIPSRPTNHMRVYQTLAMNLDTHLSDADVTAVTCDIDVDASPPVFTLYYSKNRNTTVEDQQNAS